MAREWRSRCSCTAHPHAATQAHLRVTPTCNHPLDGRSVLRWAHRLPHVRDGGGSGDGGGAQILGALPVARRRPEGGPAAAGLQRAAARGGDAVSAAKSERVQLGGHFLTNSPPPQHLGGKAEIAGATGVVAAWTRAKKTDTKAAVTAAVHPKQPAAAAAMANSTMANSKGLKRQSAGQAASGGALVKVVGEGGVCPLTLGRAAAADSCRPLESQFVAQSSHGV